jgi:hypothetical protein
MKQQHYTAITEFEVIKPTNEIETVGEKLTLSMFGEYCPSNSLRGYSLKHLLSNSKNYKPTKIIQQGKRSFVN